MTEPTEGSSIVPVKIEDEVRSSYMDYAMSIIVGRALPEVRDGLKPVHRRILYGMFEAGNTYNRSYRKSARAVGDVLGKYHPHGESAVYDAVVRMAQDFSMRAPLVDGQGNFGSVDGDPAAASRYTEVRMTRIASELLSDIEKDTIDFIPNYDGKELEPTVLPARFPNLLVNGSEGIAVGMATRIPPHNLREVVAAAIHLIGNPQATVADLMQHVPGPDFPTGAFMYRLDGIKSAYETGRGIVRLRARTEIEEDERTGKSSIIVTELPYQVNKAKLIERIAQLVREKSVEGITDLRDESDRRGMRMVIELRRDMNPQVVLNHLFKRTALEVSFGINMLAIVAGQPRVLSLKEMLECFLDFRRDVVTRRTLHELKKAQERLHILEGLKKAVDMIDEVIRTIRASADTDEAREALMALLEIDRIQSQAILDLRLQRLTGLEINKLLEEMAEVSAFIARCQAILDSETELLGIIRRELEEIHDAYGDPRRTEILPIAGDISIEDLIDDLDEVVTISHTGYIKRTQLSEYRTQRRGGKGLKGMETKDADFVEDVFVTNTHAPLLIFTTAGKAYTLKVHELPAGGRAAKGKPIVNLLPVAPDEKVAAVLPFRSFDDGGYVVTATRNGTIKKTPLVAYRNIHAGGIIAVNIADDDALINVRLCREGDRIQLATSRGMAVTFKQSDTRPMGRATTGVRGVRLREGDYTIAMLVLEREDLLLEGLVDSEEEIEADGDETATSDATTAEPAAAEPAADGTAAEADGDTIDDGAADRRTVLTVTENGYGKRTPIARYPLQNRGGLGVITIKASERNGRVAGCRVVSPDEQIILITDGGQIIRTHVREVPVLGRNTQGVRIINLEKGERVVGLAQFAERDEPETEAAAESATDGIDATSEIAADQSAADDSDVTSDDSGTEGDE
ncbi:MAG: DNA gyrase subunit A [Myxococcales bacterium]|nr:DNA gyrase subunit A [Myxococcales bacterium]